jgi:hypothetical protein
MTKSDLKLLEHIFSAEIEGRLPYQSKAAAYKRLETYGLVEHVEIALPGILPVIIPGWILTHKGRIAYCESCKEKINV